MPINTDQLARHLERGLAPCFLVSGDEPLQIDETVAAIRRRAQELGYSERSQFTVEAGFDWERLRHASQTLSLFADRRLIELRLPTGRPGEAGAALLIDLVGQSSVDTLYLIITGKLDKTQRASEWVQAIESAGMHVQIWPADPLKLPAWIAQRCAARGLQPADGVVDLLAWHMEGNMLAAAQEIDKLAMLANAGRVTLEDVEQSLADSARFSVYQLVDAVLAGEAQTGQRILSSLRREGTEPILILWALARELRSLAQLSQELARGKPENAVLARVWQQRRALMGKALRRHRAPVWLKLLQEAGHLDRLLKGRAQGDLWLECERLLLAVAGFIPFVPHRDDLERAI